MIVLSIAVAVLVVGLILCIAEIRSINLILINTPTLGRVVAVEDRIRSVAGETERNRRAFASRESDFTAIFGKLARRYSATSGLYDHLGLTYNRQNDDPVAAVKVGKPSQRSRTTRRKPSRKNTPSTRTVRRAR